MASIHFRPTPESAAFPAAETAPPDLPDALHLPRLVDREVSARGAVAAVRHVGAAGAPLAAFAALPEATRATLARSPEGWDWIAHLLEEAACRAGHADVAAPASSHREAGARGAAKDVSGALWAERALQSQIAHAPETAAAWSRYFDFLGRTGQPRKRAAVAALSRRARTVSDPSRAIDAGAPRAIDTGAPSADARAGCAARSQAAGFQPAMPRSTPVPATASASPATACASACRPALPRFPFGVTVIVPVYADPRSLAECLPALARTEGSTPWRVLLVDDASTDPAIAELLVSWAGTEPFHLRRLSTNHGYIGAVSAALALVPDGDVLLLNSDCVVPGGDWIDRLASHAAKEGVGTVTPLASDGQGFGFPRPFRAAPAFLGDRLARIDAAARQSNRGRSVRVLTSIGFCTYVTRACLEATGGLSAEALTAGYGEEVDFCLRAGRAGLHHVAATDCFVTHLGSASFGAAKRALVRRNEAALERRFPSYFARFAAQCAADPLRPARARIERALIETDARKGGVALIGRDAATLGGSRAAWRALQAGEPLRLIEVDALGAPGTTARLTSPGLLWPQNLSWRLPEERADFAADLAALGHPSVMVEPELAPRVADWLGRAAFALLPEDDGEPPLSPPLPHDLRARLDTDGYAGLYL